MTKQPARDMDLPDRKGKRHTANHGRNSGALACVGTFGPSAILHQQFVYAQLGALARKVQELEGRLECLGRSIEQQYGRDDEHIVALAACQRDTAKALNQELQRHAVYPAVEAVAALAEELSRLQERAKEPLDSGDDNGIAQLQAEIDISCCIAREKLAALDVQIIAPSRSEELDTTRHAACGYIETAEKNFHGRISKLVTPGLVYRGKVLRPARVWVFRSNASVPQP